MALTKPHLHDGLYIHKKALLASRKKDKNMSFNLELLSNFLESTTYDQNFIPTNVDVFDAMKERIARYARERGNITYSQLVQGLHFICPAFGNQPRTIQTWDWSGHDRHMIGTCLALIARDYLRQGANCLVTSIVVYATNDDGGNLPSPILFRWLEELGVLPDTTLETQYHFWGEQANKTVLYFRRNRNV